MSRRIPLLSLIGVFALGLGACASPGPSLRHSALPETDQQALYQRGQPYLQAPGPVTEVGLALARDKHLVLKITLENPGDSPQLFEPRQVRVWLAAPAGGKGEAPGRVLEYEELVSQDDDALAWDSASAATGVAGAAIPGGGWFKSAAQATARIAIAEGKRRSSAEDELASKMLTEYLRIHTLTPGSNYRGYLQVLLPRLPEAGDRLGVQVNFAGHSPAFYFRFGN